MPLLVMHWKKILHANFIIATTAVFVSLLSSPLTYATPNILGTYTGTGTINEFNCGTGAPGNPPLFPGDTYTETLTITISNQTGTSFSGSGTSDTENITFSGTVDDFGNINGSFSTIEVGDGSTSSGTLSGTISGGTFSFNIAGQDDTQTDNIFCQFTGSSTLTLISGNLDLIVNPEITPSITITTPQILDTEVKAITSDLQLRIHDVLRVWQLRRKQFPLPRERGERRSNLLPTDGDDGEVVVNSRGPGDESVPVHFQPTASGFMMNSQSGMNAGDNPYLYGAWASYSYTDFENDFSLTAFDGRRHGGLVGLDVSPWESLLLGVAVGYENIDIETDFNLGNQETEGYTIAPYLGYLLTDTWSVSVSFGYSNLDTDQHRTDPTTGLRITSSPGSDRWFGMFYLNGLTTHGNWIIGGQIGFLYAQEDIDTYTESDGTAIADFQSELGQFNIGGDIAYSYGEFEPFARVMYENDFSQTKVGVAGSPQQPSFDDDDVLLGFGVRYYGDNNLMGHLEFNTRLDREDYDEYNVTATIRYEW